MKTFTPPRGIRNNNPGNIRKSHDTWQGARQNGFDPAFVEFENPVFGLRALMKTLITYHVKYSLDTVQSIINRWAPPCENATDAYAHHVAKKLGVMREDRINLTDPKVLITLAKAIAVHENGTPPRTLPPFWFDEGVYKQASDMVLKGEKI